MEKTDVDKFKKQFKAVRPGKRCRFVYFPRGEDGKPVLKVNKRLTAADIKEIRKNAKAKKFVKGEVTMTPDRKTYAFHVAKAPPSRMQRDVRKYYGKFVPKLKGALFVTPDSAQEEAAPEAAEPSAAQLRQSVAGLREQLAVVQRRREDAEVAQAAAKRALDGTTSDSKRAPLQEAFDRREGLLGELVAEENRLREQLGMAQADLEVQMVADVDTDDIDPSALTADAVEAQHKRADEADQAAAEARAALAAQEAKLKALAERRRSKAIERDRTGEDAGRRGETARSEETLAAIEAQEEALRQELAGLRAAVEERVLASVTERARSESMLDLWNDEIAAHWQQEAPEGKLAEAEQAAAALQAKRGRARALADTLQQRVDSSAQDKKALEEKEGTLSERLAELEFLQALQGRLDGQLAEARDEFMTNTDGLEARQAEVATRLAELSQEIPNLIDEAEALHAVVGAHDDSALDDMRLAVEAARQDEAAQRQVLSAQVLSPPEQERFAQLQASRKESHEQRDRALLRHRELEAREQALRSQLYAQEDARRALDEALKLQELAKLKHKQIAEIADRTRGLRFFKKDREAIDEARGQLPEVTLELRAAEEAVARARLALEQAGEAAPVEMQADLAEVSRERLAAQETLAARTVDAATADQRVAEEDARVAALVEDLAVNHHKAAMKDYVKALPREETASLKAARAQKSQAKAAATKATMALCDAEADLEDLQAELAVLSERLAAGAVGPEALDEKLAGLQAARQQVRDLRQSADTAAAALATASAASRAEKVALLRRRRAGGDERAGELLAEQEQQRSVRAFREDTAGLDAEAQEQRARALDQLAEARRTRSVAQQADVLADQIRGGRGLIKMVHHVGDPQVEGDTSYSYDLLSEDGREAAAEKLGASDMAKLQDFQADLERRAIQMIRDGATFEELARAFADVPNGLRPPSYRAEAAAFAKLEQAFAAQDKEKAAQEQEERILALARKEMSEEELRASSEPILKAMGTTWDEFYKKFNGYYEKSGAKATTGKLTKTLGKDTDRASALSEQAEDVLKVMNVLGVAVHSLGVLKGASDIAANHQARAAEADPIKQKMLEDELMAKLSGLFSSSVKLGRDATTLAMGANPAAAVLGTLHFGKELALHAMEISARRAKEKWDGLLEQAARVAGSPLASSFEESLHREQRLLTELKVDLAIDATRIAASISQAFPPAAVIGIAVQLGAWAAQKIKEEVAEHYDAKLATKAKQLLDAARRGDDAAKTELFKFHPRYAKGLIAYMAYQENDAYALMYTRSRGLKDSDIARSSMDILTRYLLQQAKQTANPRDLKDYADKWARRRDTARDLLTYAIPGVGAVKLAIDVGTHLSKIEGALDPAAVETLQQARAATLDVLNDRQAVERAAEKARARADAAQTDEARAAATADASGLERILGTYEALFAETLQYASARLREMAVLDQQLSRHATDEGLSRKDRKALADAQKWLGALRSAEADIVQGLARAA